QGVGPAHYQCEAALNGQRWRATVPREAVTQMHDRKSAAVQVRELDSAGVRRWDDFVAASPDATFFHRAGGKRVIEESLGHRTFFLLCEDSEGVIQGVLPLVLVKSLLFGRSLSSTAFCVYGGPVTVNDAAEAALTARAIEIGERLNVQ